MERPACHVLSSSTQQQQAPPWDVPEAPQIPQRLTLSPSRHPASAGGHAIVWRTAQGVGFVPGPPLLALCPPTAATPHEDPSFLTQFLPLGPPSLWTSAQPPGCPTTHFPAQQAARAGSLIPLS